MSRTKIAITLDENTLQRVDRLITAHIFPNRSQAIQQAVEEKLQKLEHSLLAKECAKLDPKLEKALSEEGFTTDLKTWPQF